VLDSKFKIFVVQKLIIIWLWFSALEPRIDYNYNWAHSKNR